MSEKLPYPETIEYLRNLCLQYVFENDPKVVTSKLIEHSDLLGHLFLIREAITKVCSYELVSVRLRWKNNKFDINIVTTGDDEKVFEMLGDTTELKYIVTCGCETCQKFNAMVRFHSLSLGECDFWELIDENKEVQK